MDKISEQEAKELFEHFLHNKAIYAHVMQALSVRKVQFQAIIKTVDEELHDALFREFLHAKGLELLENVTLH